MNCIYVKQQLYSFCSRFFAIYCSICCALKSYIAHRLLLENGIEHLLNLFFSRSNIESQLLIYLLHYIVCLLQIIGQVLNLQVFNLWVLLGICTYFQLYKCRAVKALWLRSPEPPDATIMVTASAPNPGQICCQSMMIVAVSVELQHLLLQGGFDRLRFKTQVVEVVLGLLVATTFLSPFVLQRQTGTLCSLVLNSQVVGEINVWTLHGYGV